MLATVDTRARELVSPPEIVNRGWVHVPNSAALLAEATAVVSKALEQALADGALDQDSLRRHARKSLGRFIGQRTRSRPMIVPLVVTI